jgi:hypothetical protein
MKWLAVPILLCLMGVCGCEDDRGFENAGEEIDEAVEEVGDEIEDAADEIEDELDDNDIIDD